VNDLDEVNTNDSLYRVSRPNTLYSNLTYHQQYCHFDSDACILLARTLVGFTLSWRYRCLRAFVVLESACHVEQQSITYVDDRGRRYRRCKRTR
jgi:hypothetical protein